MRRQLLTSRCCAAVALAVLCALPAPATAHPGPTPAPAAAAGPAKSAPRGPMSATAAVEVDRLLERAAAAAERHEEARRAATLQQARAARLHRLAGDQRRWVDTLHEAIGSEARARYRGGGGSALVPAVRLMFDDDPDAFLEGAARMDHVRRVVRDLHSTAAAAEAELRRQEAGAKAALRGRQREMQAQSAARREVRETLAAAREQLREARVREAVRPGVRGLWLPRDDCGYRPYEGRNTRKKRGWTAPVSGGRLSASFGIDGPRWRHRHTGQDFAVRTGTPVRAIGSGKVVAAGCGDGFGRQLVVQHGNGYYSQYAHLSVLNVRVGDRVGTGRRIGLSGATGNVSGPHLHFEIRLTPYMGSSIDPVPWLRERGVRL